MILNPLGAPRIQASTAQAAASKVRSAEVATFREIPTKARMVHRPTNHADLSTPCLRVAPSLYAVSLGGLWTVEIQRKRTTRPSSIIARRRMPPARSSLIWAVPSRSFVPLSSSTSGARRCNAPLMTSLLSHWPKSRPRCAHTHRSSSPPAYRTRISRAGTQGHPARCCSASRV